MAGTSKENRAGTLGVFSIGGFFNSTHEASTLILDHRTPYLPPMCSCEIMMSKVNRPGSRLQPKRHGVVLSWRNSICFPDDPEVVVVKVDRFDIAGRSFRPGVHVFAPGLESSRNHKALMSAKLNQVRLDGEPHKPSGFLFAPEIVNVRDKFTKPQDFLAAACFHEQESKPENRAAAIGCSPDAMFFVDSAPEKVFGLEERQLAAAR
jgi:hypothetical protein